MSEVKTTNVIICHRYKTNTDNHIDDDEDNEIRYWYKYWKQAERWCQYPYDENMTVKEYKNQEKDYLEAMGWIRKTYEEFKIYKNKGDCKIKKDPHFIKIVKI